MIKETQLTHRIEFKMSF